MNRTRTALVLGLVLNAAALHAQGTEEEPAGPRRQIQLVPGIRYGSPLGVSVYGGVILGKAGADVVEGPTLIAEAGQDGMRASAGWSSVSLGGTLRGQLSFIRTWDSHGDVESGQTYVGPEVALGLIAGATLGHYWRISDGGGKARILSLGSFIGF